MTDIIIEEHKPEIGSFWKNKKSGEVYRVYDYTNETANRLDEYPVRISYKRLSDQTKWSRSLSDWHRSFEFVRKARVEL
jgi:hypothetical protein